MPVGFVALWKNNQREYSASSRDEWGTTDAIQAAFAKGRARGTRTYGLYSCRWSSPWQYLTFWVSPGMDAVFDTIADLERAGDFKFADSLHIYGRFIEEPGYLTDGAWDIIPERADGEPVPLGVILLERGATVSPGGALSGLKRSAQDRLSLTASLGVRMYGAFDCRFSTSWDRFTFLSATDPHALFDYLVWHERAYVLRGLETHAVIGRLAHYFRFGNHLQTSLTWLNEEDTGA